MMGIIKKLKEDFEFEHRMHNHYLSECVRKQGQINDLNKELKALKAEYKSLIESLTEYKQKYLDEQHKRLILSEQVERLEEQLKILRGSDNFESNPFNE